VRGSFRKSQPQSSPLTRGRKQIQFPKRCVFSVFFKHRTMDKAPQNPIIPNVIRRHQNPLKSAFQLMAHPALRCCTVWTLTTHAGLCVLYMLRKVGNLLPDCTADVASKKTTVLMCIAFTSPRGRAFVNTVLSPSKPNDCKYLQCEGVLVFGPESRKGTQGWRLLCNG
jgi:hypothetical protein